MGRPTDAALNKRYKELAELEPQEINFETFRRGKSRETRKRIAASNKYFVVWDGEGAKVPDQKQQDYMLFGCYNGFKHEWISSDSHLTTAEILSFIIKHGRNNPGGIHVSFAFGYDITMIFRDMPRSLFARLSRKGSVMLGHYRIEHVPGKWLRITDRVQKCTVTIQDAFGFFQTSLVKALKANIPNHPKMQRIADIEAGKVARDAFTHADFDYVLEYWKIENELLAALMEHLKEMLYDERVNFQIKQWHGPGAVANYIYRANGIGKHKADCGSAVYSASRYAYAGGRFEIFRAGRHSNVYSYDINSAYPYAISRLPSLSEGFWQYVEKPNRLAEFGVYRVRMDTDLFNRRPSPLFHREPNGLIYFPWHGEGWYWTPEVQHILSLDNCEIIEGWEYIGWETRPFEFVHDLYEQRRRMKADGDGAQMAIKLGLNSLYGKMAQRAGWERKGGAPTWHQLEWAGYVTAYTRAMLYGAMQKMDWSQLIAVETDGLYTTAPPEQLGITDSRLLGEWEIGEYDELYYLQSGIYAGRKGNKWEMKYRGLDHDSVSPEKFVDQTRQMGPNSEWPSLVGTTTRFVGYRLASHRGIDAGVWERELRRISVGSEGKRIHLPSVCAACELGATAYEMAHDLVISPRAIRHAMSEPHAIPWINYNEQLERKRYGAEILDKQ